MYQEVVLARSRIVALPITARPARARVVASAPMPDDPPEIASDLGPAEAMAVARLLSRATEAWPEVAPAIVWPEPVARATVRVLPATSL